MKSRTEQSTNRGETCRLGGTRRSDLVRRQRPYGRASNEWPPWDLGRNRAPPTGCGVACNVMTMTRTKVHSRFTGSVRPCQHHLATPPTSQSENPETGQTRNPQINATRHTSTGVGRGGGGGAWCFTNHHLSARSWAPQHIRNV